MYLQPRTPTFLERIILFFIREKFEKDEYSSYTLGYKKLNGVIYITAELNREKISDYMKGTEINGNDRLEIDSDDNEEKHPSI